MRDLTLKIFMATIITALAIAILLGAWFVGRKFNYKLSYENMVKETVSAMVKDEALK